MSKKENKIIKIATTIIRIFFGALLVFASIAYFFKLFPAPELEGKMKIFSEGIDASVYLMPLVKGIELICGILFIVNLFVRLATIVIFPIVVNILAVHSFLAPEGLPFALFMVVANLVLILHNRHHYKSLLVIK
jgi:uncharacterized membrane protein YphA (DoxX/SURF4 family)